MLPLTIVREVREGSKYLKGLVINTEPTGLVAEDETTWLSIHKM